MANKKKAAKLHKAKKLEAQKPLTDIHITRLIDVPSRPAT
jgi:hypothetical protein